ncbi:Cdc37 family protein [Coccidioides posadasii C735 delta SOWgp]|uniref:Hsp90 chaperone protein kinase-targeting subunit n=1 Tax=Coccidioides posadasii (strain C735) TaxID=222929 RepID=C5P397_COCP7|nr:Cdc37 family protein [Coccidioides posadasii C735 delta SOWgp]EER28785.1 Cdc37 family protein [Coccidioides posadasii C735 delta SOWgp]|eukprot:XP_003070930.1 Cdc37 family protein [Coccidioides posadasii C735 delta SOWgp]
MVLDYSKWDALELSDDSDIEVHPNVDKRSFIRAKQNQIHQQRFQRRQEIATLKYERIINDGLLQRIDGLLAALRKHEDSTRHPDELVFQALIESAGEPEKDQPPPPPEGVYTQEKDTPKFSQMMGSLVDQVKKELDETKPENRFQGFIKGVEGHKNKVLSLQQELLVKLAQLEKEESSKITSESIHTGFNSTFIAKPKAEPKQKQKESTVELLNAGSLTKDEAGTVSSGAEADEEPEPGDEEEIKVTPLAKQFAKLKVGDYRSTLQFIMDHPEIVTERKTDELLMEAFNGQMSGEDDYARQCVHQGLLLQYCRALGRDGVSLFFKRITTKDHRANVLFHDDVNSTYNRIKTRAHELSKKSEGVEQIQLHAVDPSTKISITIPPADSTDPQHIAARETFERFPPGLQRALESQNLDEINKVLGKMSVDEAEEVVEKLGESGILSLEEGIVDFTTEEGKKMLEEIEAREKQSKEEEEIGDPE